MNGVIIVGARATAASLTVKMKDNFYEPQRREIRIGESVVWRNEGGDEHTATSDDGKTFDTGIVRPGASSRPVQFDKPVEFKYHCTVHGTTMNGVIVVGVIATRSILTVKMQDNFYEPRKREILVGDSVVWKNEGGDEHTATSDDNGKTFDTRIVAPGDSSRPVQFNSAGEFKYHCTVHGTNMSGVIIVKPLHNADGGTQDELITIEKDWASAVETNDPKQIGRFLGDDFLFVGPGGILQTRAEHLEEVRSGRLRIASVQIGISTVQIYGDAAVVSSRVAVEGKVGERDISGSYQFTDTFVRGKDRRWLAVARQQTRVVPRSVRSP